MYLVYRNSFKKDAKKLRKNIQEKLKERLKLFLIDKFSPELNNHKLKGKYEDFSSINISGDLRALFIMDGDYAVFTKIDNHGNLYD